MDTQVRPYTVLYHKDEYNDPASAFFWATDADDAKAQFLAAHPGYKPVFIMQTTSEEEAQDFYFVEIVSARNTQF